MVGLFDITMNDDLELTVNVYDIEEVKKVYNGFIAHTHDDKIHISYEPYNILSPYNYFMSSYSTHNEIIPTLQMNTKFKVTNYEDIINFDPSEKKPLTIKLSPNDMLPPQEMDITK